MRTLILAVTVLLLAAPVWADVEITAVKDAGNDRLIVISYVSTEAQLIRAFALDFNATGGNITDVNDYALDGDNNGGYGIFPGSFCDNIVVDPCGVVSNWDVEGYSPVAPAGDPDALGGIGTPGVTVEMGSLYTDAPPSMTGGILCTVTVDEDVTELCVTANAIRGNVVLEDANEPQNLTLPDGDTGTDCVTWGGECFPSTPNYALQYADWVAYAKPDCWCNSSAIAGEPTQLGDYQCYGDANGDTEGGLKYRVSLDDLNLIIANWKKRMSSTPPPDPCADVDHKSEGGLKYRVSLNDLNVVIEYWKKRDSALDPNCPHPDPV